MRPPKWPLGPFRLGGRGPLRLSLAYISPLCLIFLIAILLVVSVHLGIFKVHETLWICTVTSAGDGFEGFCVRVVLEAVLGTRSLFQRTEVGCAPGFQTGS